MSSSPVRVELQVARHLSMRHGVWRLLQAEGLEVHASAAVRDDEVRIHGTLHPSGIFTEEREKLLDAAEKKQRDPIRPAESQRSHSLVALARQSVALQAGRQRDVVDDAAAAATLQTHLGGLRLHSGGRDDDAVHLHQARHLLGLRRGRERQDEVKWSAATKRARDGTEVCTAGTLRPRMEV